MSPIGEIHSASPPHYSYTCQQCGAFQERVLEVKRCLFCNKLVCIRCHQDGICASCEGFFGSAGERQKYIAHVNKVKKVQNRWAILGSTVIGICATLLLFAVLMDWGAYETLFILLIVAGIVLPCYLELHMVWSNRTHLLLLQKQIFVQRYAGLSPVQQGKGAQPPEPAGPTQHIYFLLQVPTSPLDRAYNDTIIRLFKERYGGWGDHPFAILYVGGAGVEYEQCGQLMSRLGLKNKKAPFALVTRNLLGENPDTMTEEVLDGILIISLRIGFKAEWVKASKTLRSRGTCHTRNITVRPSKQTRNHETVQKWFEDVDTYWTQFRDLVSAVFGKAISNETTFPKVI